MPRGIRDELQDRRTTPQRDRPPATSRGAGVAAPTPPRPVGLSAGHFRKIATNGFGDGGNSYAYSYSWYNDHVYIGTIRHLLVLVKLRIPIDTPGQVWPVPAPKSDRDLDLCAQIWRYSPVADSWERVYRSPMTKGLNDRDV